MTDLFDLSGRVALVTGGSKGIGRMIAETLVDVGVRVYITARHADVVEQTAAELSASGECIAIPNDLGSFEGVLELAAEIRRREPELHILVNNAGTGWVADFEHFPEKGWEKTFGLNLKAPFFLIQKLMPLLRAAASAARPAKIINISSVDAIYVTPDDTYSYSAAKAGLNHLTRHLAKDLARDHIHINSISPGAFASDMNVKARDEPELFKDHVPAGRIGSREDIGGTIVYMASRAGDYLVGVNLTLDGGVCFARAG